MRRTFHVDASLGLEPRRGKIAKRSGNCWPIADAIRPRRAQLYDSARALENIYPGNGDGAFITTAEAVRRLKDRKRKRNRAGHGNQKRRESSNRRRFAYGDIHSFFCA